MFIKRKEYNELLQDNVLLTEKNFELDKELKELKDDSGHAMLERLQALAKQCGINTHGDEYQTFMHRMFMAVAGRESDEAKAYSAAAFMKDNEEDILDRMKKFQKQASIITKEIEAKKK